MATTCFFFKLYFILEYIRTPLDEHPDFVCVMGSLFVGFIVIYFGLCSPSHTRISLVSGNIDVTLLI
jgi:hypothetical protein